MAEIYRDTVGKAVTLDISSAVVTNVTFKRDGDVVASSTTSPAQIPYSITHNNGDFDVVWTYMVDGVSYSRVDRHTIVSPMFTQSELVAFNGQFVSLDSDAVVTLERMCRQIIESITRQSFSYREGKLTVTAPRTGTVLQTKERVISVAGVNAGLAFTYPFAYRPIKTGFGIESATAEWSGGVFSTNGAITDPYANHKVGFVAGMSYVINGAFGWEAIPSDIKDAALLLAELFSCDEASWRDRYIKSVTAADWRFDFDGRAFSGTGSVTVDQLLSKYIVGGMAIV